MPLVVVLEVSTGMIQGIMARLLEVKSYHLQLPLDPRYSDETIRSVQDAVSRLPGVVAVVFERRAVGLLYSRTGASGVVIRCVPEDFLSVDTGLAGYLKPADGRLEFPSSAVVLLGAGVARTLGVVCGDDVTLLTTFGGDFKGIPKATRFLVGGIYTTGYEALDKAFVYMAAAAGQPLLSSRNSSRFLGVKVKDPFRDIEGQAAAVGSAVPGGLPATPWTYLEGPSFQSFEATRTMLLFIMALVVIVASVNIFSSVLMLLIEKRQEIGILMGLGARPGDVSSAFLLAGLVLGVIGTALGLALGLAVAVNINGCIAGLQALADVCVGLAAAVSGSEIGPITLFHSAYYLEEIPIRIGLPETVGIAFGTILVSALASYLPARRAGRMKPLEIIRKAS